MSTFKDAVIDELLDNNYVDLARTIDKIDNDVDVANYINASKHHFTQTMSSKDLEGMPKFSSALFGKLKTGKVDYAAEFGKDWYNNYEEIPYQEIKFVADKQGVNPTELTKQMGEDAIKQRRQDIAKGKDPDATLIDKVGGTALSLFGRRQQEAIARGEDPEFKDYAGDIGEQAAYFVPYGAIAKGLGAGSKIGRILTYGSNAVVPLAAESYDTAVYDDTNPRGNFSFEDVITGTTVNAAAPWVLKGAAMGVGKFINKPDFNKAVMNYANVDQPMKGDRISKLLSGTRNTSQAARQKYNQQINDNAELASKKLTAEQLSEGFAYDKAYHNTFDKLYAKLAARNGKLKKGYDPNKQLNAGTVNISYNEAMKDFTPEELKFILNDSELRNMLTAELSNMPTLMKVAGQDAVKNYITNQYGNIWAEDRNPWTRLGYPGVVISNKLKGDKEEEQRKLEEARILEELREKYGTPEEPKTYRMLKGDR